MCEFKVREVVLKNGEEIIGMVVPISPARVLIQTDEMCLELSETEIQSLDGKKDFRNLIKPYNSAVDEAITIHQYNEDGSMISLDKMKLVNTSDQVLGKVLFVLTSSKGITKEFEEQFHRQERFDAFGNLLPITIEKELGDGWGYSIELSVPVAPGDIYEITIKDAWPRWAERENDHWFTRHHLSHKSETTGNIHMLTFILPRGAEISSAAPQPLRQFDFNGKPTITWKRYLPPKEDITFEARYKL